MAPFFAAKDRQSLLVVVGRQAAAVRDVLRRPMTGEWRQRLYEVSVGLHTEAGLLGLDLYELDVADGCFALARAAAQDSGDGRLQAQALQLSTYRLTSLRYAGDGGDDKSALTLVEQAAVHADTHTRGETLRRLAEQRALDGDEPGFQRALKQAYQEFGRIDGSERGFSARSEAYLSLRCLRATAGMGCMALQRNGEALREFQAAVDDPAMSLIGEANTRADMARCGCSWVSRSRRARS